MKSDIKRRKINVKGNKRKKGKDRQRKIHRKRDDIKSGEGQERVK